MFLPICLIISTCVYTAIAAPSTTTNSLDKRAGFDSECRGQVLPPGTWYAAFVTTYHRFAGTEDNGRAKACYWATKAEAQDDLWNVCQLAKKDWQGCYWDTLDFDKVVVPPLIPCEPKRPAESAPASGGCYQQKDSCGGPACSTQNFISCVTTGKTKHGCEWKDPPRPRETGAFLPLNRYHSGCNSKHKSKTPECVAAMHSYCMYSGLPPIGIPQEASPTSEALGFLCTDANFFGDVSYGSIPGCGNGQSQSGPCYSSLQTYCDSIGIGGVGIIQEVTSSVAGVACVPYNTFHAVKMTVLQAKHAGCTSSSQAQNPDCAAAVHRYCSESGFGQGGVVTKLGTDEVAVGCISQGTFQEVRI